MKCGADKYFWRQSLVLLADSFQSVGTGFVLSFPSVLNPVILSASTTDIKATKDQASWISSVYGFAGVIGFCIMPGLMQKYGRKFAHIALNMIVGIGFIIFTVADDVPTLLAARIIQGTSICAVYLTSIILSEYTQSNRRGYFITLKKSAVALGSLTCHFLMLICSWRKIAAIASMLSIMAVILTIPWPESPAYLAMKGRYEDCGKSYIYLHGDTPKTRKEIDDLITAQMDRLETQGNKKNKKEKMGIICNKFVRRDFLKPFFIITLLTVIIDSGGRYYNLVYIVQIIKDLIGDNSIAVYCSIGLDFLTMIACWTSSYVITKFSRRTLLFAFGFFSVALMFLISLTVYLKSKDISTNFVWLTLFLIFLNCFSINMGVIPVCFAVSGEIFPLEHRGSGTTATGLMFTLLYGITIKGTPIIMDNTGIEGVYGIYGLCLMISLTILVFILMETKDKTLQEIEDEIKGIKRGKAVKTKEREKLTNINANTDHKCFVSSDF